MLTDSALPAFTTIHLSRFAFAVGCRCCWLPDRRFFCAYYQHRLFRWSGFNLKSSSLFVRYFMNTAVLPPFYCCRTAPDVPSGGVLILTMGWASLERILTLVVGLGRVSALLEFTGRFTRIILFVFTFAFLHIPSTKDIFCICILRARFYDLGYFRCLFDVPRFLHAARYGFFTCRRLLDRSC